MIGPPPLHGIRVVEFAGLAPGPFAGMLLADGGASVLRIDRPVSSGGGAPPPAPDMLARHKSSISVDLKDPRGVALVRDLITGTPTSRPVDVLIDPFRPGVLESLGLGPDALCAANPRLVYARLAGFRRDGAADDDDGAAAAQLRSRYAHMAGHDINYLAVSGVLHMLGRAGERPNAPWNLLADFAGGGMALFAGVVMALLARERRGGGMGQVVEANMVDGSSYVATFARMALRTPVGEGPRGTNLLDGGCPYYDTYETAREAGAAGEAQYVAVGALEPQFFAALLRGLGLDEDTRRRLAATRSDRAAWPPMRELFARIFASRSRAHWEAVFDGTDACVTPVLSYAELDAGRRGRGGRREGDQRPLVALRATPMLAVQQGVEARNAPRQGQGPGVRGDGYTPGFLAPGEGGEVVLEEWMGWRKGVHFGVDAKGNGALILLTGKDTDTRAEPTALKVKTAKL